MSNTKSGINARRRATHRAQAAPDGSTASAEVAFGGGDDRRAALVAFFRALARRVEQDPAFARALLAVYAESTSGAAAPSAAQGRPASTTAGGISDKGNQPHPAATAPDLLDPFAILREQGEAALRERLTHLDLASLRAIMRAHRLDPARIAARWTARERIVDLIVEQVRARASLGRAFAHV